MRKAPRGCRWKRNRPPVPADRNWTHRRYCHACGEQKPFLGSKVIPSRSDEPSGAMICAECWDELQGDREMFLAYLSGFERLLQRARVARTKTMSGEK
jgi:hypothetical protein